MTHDTELTQTDLLFRRMRFQLRRMEPDSVLELPDFTAAVHRKSFFKYVIMNNGVKLKEFKDVDSDTRLNDVMAYLENRYVEINTPEHHRKVIELSELPLIANIPGYSDYVVAYDGEGVAEVWSFATIETKPKHEPIRLSLIGGKIVNLYSSGKLRPMNINRVLALAWHGEPKRKELVAVCKAPGIYTPSSVVWVTHREAQRMAQQAVDDLTRRIIVSRVRNGDSASSVARDYGLAHSTVLRYVRSDAA